MSRTIDSIALWQDRAPQSRGEEVRTSTNSVKPWREFAPKMFHATSSASRRYIGLDPVLPGTLLAASILFILPCQTSAQTAPPTPHAEWVCPNGSSGGAGAAPACGGVRRPASGFGPVQPRQPSAAEIEAKNHSNAQQFESDGTAYFSNHDYANAVATLEKAHALWPENLDISNELAGAQGSLYDSKLIQPLDNSIAATSNKIDAEQHASAVNTVGLDFAYHSTDAASGAPKEGLALRQARVAAAGEMSADCIMDGRPGCSAPIPLVVLGGGEPALPPDAVRFVESIPENVRQSPAVARNLAMYEHFAGIRGEAQNTLVADVAVAKAHPDDTTVKTRLAVDAGKLTGAANDEAGAKKLLHFSVAPIVLGPATDKADGP